MKNIATIAACAAVLTLIMVFACGEDVSLPTGGGGGGGG
jgi:hypothetical protein